jgi:hypothetical protein
MMHQDIVHYLQTGGHCTRAVRGVVLQVETQPMLELAEKMIKEGKGKELMPRSASPEAPITANRYYLQIIYVRIFCFEHTTITSFEFCFFNLFAGSGYCVHVEYSSAYFFELCFSECAVRKNGEALDPLKWVHL